MRVFFVFGIFLSLLWELPAMLAISLHQLFCASTGGSLSTDSLTTWAYRAIGIFVVWPVVLTLLGLLSLGSAAATFAQIVLLLLAAVVVWAQLSRKGQ